MDHDCELLADILEVYRPECRYLKTATAQQQESGVTARGEFSIPEPFYIDATGHFNAVEFNICYNQLAYFAAAKCVADGMLAPLGDWTLAEYRERQLPSFLIVQLSSRFRRALHSPKFYGEVTFTDIRETSSSTSGQALYIMNTECRFWDDAGGKSDGTVKLAVVNPPARLARVAS